MFISNSGFRNLLCSLCLTVLAFLPKSFAADIVNLGILTGDDTSLARGVSANGVVTGISTGDGASEAIRWSGGVMTGLGLLPIGGGTYSEGYGISADGTRIAGTADALGGTVTRAFLWNGSYQAIAPLSGGTYTFGYGISADGVFVVGESDGGSTHPSGQAFRWSSGGSIEGLGVVSGESSSTAYGASVDGSVVVGVSGSYGFRWESGVMNSLGLLSGGTYSSAFGTSADGSVVVGFADDSSSNMRAFRWESSVMSDLGALPGESDSVARAVSPDGYVTVGYSGSDAFVWRSGFGMEKLQDVLVSAGATGIGAWTELAEAYSITGNAIDGYSIAGYGFVDGDQRAFLVTGLFAVPEPSSSVMAILATLSIVGLTRYSGRSRLGC